jgi:hypothetical protein
MSSVFRVRAIDSVKYCNYVDDVGYCCTNVLNPLDGSSKKYCKLHKKTLGGYGSGVDDVFDRLFINKNPNTLSEIDD